MQIIILSIAAFASTFLGGLFAVRFKHKLPLIMAFAAGVILGVVCFDIFPEIIRELKNNNFSPTKVMMALAVGFLLFHILEKTILIHHAHEADYADHKHPRVGVLSALALIGHSFMDGASIGLGFQVSASAGIMVALAVIAHDFTDGMNTITLMLNHKNSTAKAKLFLFFDSAAPIAGAVATLFIKIPPNFLVMYLGFFAGFLLYIGASDILPEAHSQKSSYQLIGLTILGAALIFLVSQLA
ncbi:MAG: ZIP family metal transporter [bacterium]|nr:ZIP family metal transporter [bacterium]